jgi:hypothetical protein
VTLKEREFRYYKEATGHPEGQLCGVINFDLYNVKIEKDKDDHSFTMGIKGTERTFQWRVKSNKTPEGIKAMEEWVRVISLHI